MIQFENIPPKFLEMHRKQIMGQMIPDGTFRIHPREPLGAIDDLNLDATVKLVELQAINGIIKPLSDSIATILDWENRHKNTTLEEFDWLPFK